MPQIEVTSELKAQLTAAARARGCTPAELVAALLRDPESAVPEHPLVGFISSAAFRAKFSDADRYIALLSWIATNHPAEFADFIEHASSGRRYLGLSADEIRETCRHNQARSIDGTRYWAIMNLDTPTKRRFLRRLMVFVGMPDDVIARTTATLAGR
jgi:negative modulator of initiation of replication